MFYTFSQNNSGGSFDLDKVRGITHFVIVEGDSIEDITRRAENIGLYFDGGGDCPCCGNRWSEPWHNDGDDSPTIYGQSPTNYVNDQGNQGWGLWMKSGEEICIHYKDGRMEWF